MSLSRVEVQCNAASPVGLRVPLIQRTDPPADPNPPDFTTATACRFVVRAQNGAEVEWTGTLSGLSTPRAIGIYVFAADGSDTALPASKNSATYLVTPWVTFTGVGERPMRSFNLIVTRTPF